MKKSPLKAHSADTWVNCTGSVKLSNQFPRIETGEGVSEAMLEGLAFHELAAQILLSFKTPGADLIYKCDRVGTISKDGIVITDEIYDCALEYTNDVLNVCNKNGTLQNVHIEDRVNLDVIYPDMYGYIDCWLLDEKAATLYVWDAKFGHRTVNAFENWQLLTYAAGLIEQLGINGVGDQYLKVSLRVAQPRTFRSGGPIDEWMIQASDLRGYFNTLKAAAVEAYSDEAKCTTGNQCGYCPARYACTALQTSTFGAIDYISDAEGVTLSGNDLAFELRILKRAEKALKARLSGLEEQALSELRNGKVLPGFTCKQGYGRKRWTKSTPIEEVIMMCDLMGIDARKPVTLDTPAQILKKGVDESVIALYSETPKTAMKLVEDNGSKARNVFKKG